MSRKVPFSRLARFTGDAERDLALLEGNVAAKMRTDDVQEWGPLEIIQNVTSTYTAKAWDLVECDPGVNGSVTVVLPDPRAGANVKAWVAVKNTSDSTNPITVTAQSGALIDGDTSHVCKLARAFQWFYSNGQKWNRGPSHQQYAPPRLANHTADANTVALWQLNPPDNGGSGLVDSSGHGLTLAMGAGTERYGPLGYGLEGAMCDGTNYWQRAGAVNDASLNLTGNMTVEYLVRLLVQPPGRVTAAVTNGAACVTYAAVGETGGNDNVLWASWLENANAFGPNVAGVFGTSWFWETGAGVNSAIEDQALVSMFDPHHVAVVRSAGGATVTTYIDGFIQSVTTGQPVGTIGGAPIQFVRIGADHNAAQFLSGVIGSVKISNVARSSEYIYNDAARCLGGLHRGVVTSV